MNEYFKGLMIGGILMVLISVDAKALSPIDLIDEGDAVVEETINVSVWSNFHDADIPTGCRWSLFHKAVVCP